MATDSVGRISGVTTVSKNGTGPAKKRENAKRAGQNGRHDTVSISDEARKRFTSDENEDQIADDEH